MRKFIDNSIEIEKDVNMNLDNLKVEKNNNVNIMGKIISEGLSNPIVKSICTHGKGKNYDEIKKIQNEFCRFVGFCILFRSSQDIGSYMLLTSKSEQIQFLKEKIAEKLEIPTEEITERIKEIVEYAYQNFKQNGYVFHAANSNSIKIKMTRGLVDNIANTEQQKELLHIESIYKKYDPEGLYSPLGHGATDILDNKTGWFFDGFPIHSTTYANSPQWFGYLCGKSYVYFDSIPEERRNGYANKDYKTSLEAVIWLVKSKNMDIEDRKEILRFFIKHWNEYKDTTPCLMLIPVKEVGINDDIKLEQYLSEEGTDLLFNDIISGKVSPIKNICCKKTITPEKLSYVDLSPILPKFKIERKIAKKAASINQPNQRIIKDDGEER